MKNDELRICGLASVRARWRRDPQSVLRLFFDLETGRRIGLITKALASSRRVYRCVESAELERVAGTVHHGGVVAIVRPPRLGAPSPADYRRWAGGRVPLLVLDRIGNAHNLGALARTAAFFGVEQLVLAEDPAAARPNDAAFRVAEGGLEQVQCWSVPDIGASLRALREAGYAVVGAATRGGKDLRPDHLAERLGGSPVALVLGNEEHGMSAAAAATCSHLVTLPGSGRVESLNVSVAGAVLLWEAFGKTAGRRSVKSA